LAFFFAAIIVSFKVNLGIVHVRFAVRTPVARFFERLQLSSIVLRENPRKPRTVHQFYATVKKKCNTFVEKMLTTELRSVLAATAIARTHCASRCVDQRRAARFAT
jgi:hypothetical protein